MDGSLRYASGGRGIFDHLDGPYAGPTSAAAVEVLGSGMMPGGFGALGQEGVDASSVSAASADLVRSLTEGKIPLGPTEKRTLEEAIHAAGAWAESSQAWYRRPSTWAWVICGTVVVGGAAVAWKLSRRKP